MGAEMTGKLWVPVRRFYIQTFLSLKLLLPRLLVFVKRGSLSHDLTPVFDKQKKAVFPHLQFSEVP